MKGILRSIKLELIMGKERRGEHLEGNGEDEITKRVVHQYDEEGKVVTNGVLSFEIIFKHALGIEPVTLCLHY